MTHPTAIYGFRLGTSTGVIHLKVGYRQIYLVRVASKVQAL